MTGGWRSGCAKRGGAILACFGDAKPSNDFESTRLVARIIQFEYVYGACGANGPRAYIRVPIGARVIPAYITGVYIYIYIVYVYTPSHALFSRSRNIDITVESHPPLLSRATSHVVSFSFIHHLPLSLSLVLSSRIWRVGGWQEMRAFASIEDGSSVTEHVRRDTLIFLSSARDNTRPRVEDTSITCDAPWIFIFYPLASAREGGFQATSQGISLRAAKRWWRLQCRTQGRERKREKGREHNPHV